MNNYYSYCEYKTKKIDEKHDVSNPALIHLFLVHDCRTSCIDTHGLFVFMDPNNQIIGYSFFFKDFFLYNFPEFVTFFLYIQNFEKSSFHYFIINLLRNLKTKLVVFIVGIDSN